MVDNVVLMCINGVDVPPVVLDVDRVVLVVVEDELGIVEVAVIEVVDNVVLVPINGVDGPPVVMDVDEVVIVMVEDELGIVEDEVVKVVVDSVVLVGMGGNDVVVVVVVEVARVLVLMGVVDEAICAVVVDT